MTNFKKWLVPAILIVVVTLALFFVLQPQSFQVEVATLEKRTLSVLVEEQGRTRARDPYIVAAPISGRLLRSVLDEGDRVSQGQVIARIALSPDDPRTQAVSQANLVAAEARYSASQAALQEAEGAYARAMREEERREELFKNNLTSSEEREYYRQVTDSAQARRLSMQASVQAAAAEVESAKSLLLGMNWDNEAAIQAVNSPVDGTVYRVFEESERVVQAGTPLFEISNDDSLEIVVDLLTQDAVGVKPGAPILISGWGQDEVLQGTVLYKEPEAFTKISALGVEEQRVNVIGEFNALPVDFGAEYRIDTGIVIWEQDNVLTIPQSALFQRNNRWQTFVAQGGKAQIRELEIGQRGRNYAQVLGGLEEGEQVVLFPSDLINAGTKIEY